MNNITVAIRVKPCQQQFKTVLVDQNNIVLLDPEQGVQNSVDVLKKNRIKEVSYDFDMILDQQVDQKEVYDRTTEPLLEDLLSGQNVTVFAYGATGAGKTHTMMGSNNSFGIIPRAMNDLYLHIPKTEIQNVQISFLEIYNETIKDLLTGKACDLRDDGQQGLVVVGLVRAPAPNIVEANNLIKIGNAKRAKEATGANENSTRSHTVMQLILQQSTLSFVDLAGSERASQTNNRGQRMVEGAMINRSLLVLGNCIQALCHKESFVPYRGSKLTRLLKDALAGNSKTVMIANICPLHYEDSYNTLLYANRTRYIESPSLNFSQVIDTLRGQNDDLKKQIKRQGSQIKVLEQIVPDENQLPRHFELERQLLSHMFQLEDTMTQIQLEIIDHEKAQFIKISAATQDLIDQKNQKINQLEIEQYDHAVKYKELLNQRKRVYDIAIRQSDEAKNIYKQCLQDLERMKAQQAAKRNQMRQKFKELEIEYLKQKSNRTSSMPKYDEATLKEIKKNRLMHVNKQIKEGKL